MSRLTLNQVLLSGILSITAIALAAITLNYSGVINVNFAGEWFQIKIESGNQTLL